MKPVQQQLKYVLPTRGGAVRARRKLSTAGLSPLPSSPPPFYSSFDSPSSPRLLKNGPTTAITTYTPPSGSSQSSSSTGTAQLVTHPRSTNGYPGGGGYVPLIWLVPSGTNGNNEIERQLPWEGPGEGTSKDGRAYTLEMGAYGIPKRRRHDHEQDHEEAAPATSSSLPSSSSIPSSSSAKAIPKEDPAHYNLSVQVGEDAYFLRPDALGVADGVGGWKHKGESNSALFAKKLMHFCSVELANAVESSSSPSSTGLPPEARGQVDVDPIGILQSSYERCVSEARESGLLGSSTATLAILANSELRIAHVGDCVVCVVRDGEMVFRSDEMQHSFNYPFQLGPRSTTTPKADAQHLTVPVKPNDIVILASDGMGDNLWDEDVLDEVSRFIRSSPSPPPATSPSSSTTPPPPPSILTFAASSSSTLAPLSSPTASMGAHAPAGPVTNTVLAQRLSEALASRAKRVSERRAMTADASGTMGAFGARRNSQPTSSSHLQHRHPPTPPPTPLPTPMQTPTPPPSPKLAANVVEQIEGMELPKHTSSSITQSDGQLDDVDFVGDGFGGDGEYGGSGSPLVFEEDVDEEWVSDEIPFGRRAKEAGVRFVGGKRDDISVLVAIISGAPPVPPLPLHSTSPPPGNGSFPDFKFQTKAGEDAMARLRATVRR